MNRTQLVCIKTTASTENWSVSTLCAPECAIPSTPHTNAWFRGCLHVQEHRQISAFVRQPVTQIVVLWLIEICIKQNMCDSNLIPWQSTWSQRLIFHGRIGPLHSLIRKETCMLQCRWTSPSWRLIVISYFNPCLFAGLSLDNLVYGSSTWCYCPPCCLHHWCIRASFGYLWLPHDFLFMQS